MALYCGRLLLYADSALFVLVIASRIIRGLLRGRETTKGLAQVWWAWWRAFSACSEKVKKTEKTEAWRGDGNEVYEWMPSGKDVFPDGAML